MLLDLFRLQQLQLLAWLLIKANMRYAISVLNLEMMIWRTINIKILFKYCLFAVGHVDPGEWVQLITQILMLPKNISFKHHFNILLYIVTHICLNSLVTNLSH